jgi:hypothetical protein
MLSVRNVAMLLPNDPADLLSFVIRTRCTLISLLLCSVTACVICYLKPFRGKRTLAFLLFSAALLLGADVLRKVNGREMLLTLLGSEDDYMAEQAYRQLDSQAQVIWVLARINDKKEDSNVRFYLARMVSSIPEATKRRDEIIGKINPDPITPRFFAVNAFNSDVRMMPAPLTTRNVAWYYWIRTADKRTADH